MNNKDKLLGFLVDSEDWVDSTALSRFLCVTSRTIRNYINEINALSESDSIIESSSKGYKINRSNFENSKIHKVENHNSTFSPKERCDFILKKCLTSSSPIQFFELSEELFISESTLEADLSKVRHFISDFELTIHHDHELILLKGFERNKRKLMSSIIRKETYDDFMSIESLNLISNEFNLAELYHFILHAFALHELFINDYAVNNLIIHLAISIDRIKNKKLILELDEFEKLNGTLEYTVALEVAKYIEEKLKTTLSESEVYYIALTISSNTSIADFSIINRQNLADYINLKYIDITNNALKKVEDTYYLEPFDDDFFIKFTIHVSNLFKRVRFNSSVHNPLANKIKRSYPLIYDIAVFIAHEFHKNEKVFLNEDEIAYLAFHIGAYLEKSKKLEKKIHCLFIYADYYSIQQIAYDKLSTLFSDSMILLDAISIQKFNVAAPNIDMIISTVALNSFTEIPVVNVNIFITSEDIEMIRVQLNRITASRENKNLRNHLQRFIKPQLFKKNFYTKDEFEMIENLTKETFLCDYTNEDFTQEALEREKMSSTAFGSYIAIPHSLNQNAKKSFISVVLNEKSMRWGTYDVNIIILIGISKDDRTSFREIFDYLIEIVSDTSSVDEIIQCKDYEEFIDMIINLIH